MPDRSFWRGRKVFLTGHTGFKGSWLSLWLSSMGAEVTGYSLDAPSTPSLFELARIGDVIRSVHGDVRDADRLSRSLAESRAETVFHMAAQALVQESYRDPVGTYGTNVMGTVNLLEAARKASSVQAVVVITTDKCYENSEWPWGYREIDRLGGNDPYSNSKACAELVVSAYRSSFGKAGGPRMASARAGNVIGGGDWAQYRLVPDCMRALSEGKPICVRNPLSIRPWQHVLEPLSGYLLLAKRMCEETGDFEGAWNFGPADDDARSVDWVVKKICELWGPGSAYQPSTEQLPHEARSLRLDCSKARLHLGWRPAWDLDHALGAVVQWHRRVVAGANARDVTLEQISTREREQM